MDVHDKAASEGSAISRIERISRPATYLKPGRGKRESVDQTRQIRKLIVGPCQALDDFLCKKLSGG